ncbi:MAG: hypothetical protein MJ089_03500 [Ruminococcus sp.]|nr:hypothetical protein [Ruminococcus sp.]
MKEKIIGILKSNLFFALVINLIIITFCINISAFAYDNISDYYNSINICHYQYYYNNNINYIFSNIVGSLQIVLTNINCYVLALVGLSLISFITITYVFADKYNKPKSLILSLIINILFALHHYADIERTKTAAILLAAGFLLVLNAIRNKRYNLPCWIGVTEIALGSFLSFDYFFIALAFSVAYFLADMISKRKYKIAFRKFFWYFRPFLLMFFLVGLIIVGLYNYSYSVNNSNPEVRNYYEYSELCDSINNLPYPDYKENKEQFALVGINSENDYELLKNGYYDSEKSLNIDALRLVSALQQENNSKTYLGMLGNTFTDIFNHLSIFDTYAVIIIIYLLSSVTYIIYQKTRYCFFPIFYSIVALASGVYIRYEYSSKNYLIYGIWLIMLIMLFYSVDSENQRKFISSKITSKHKLCAIITAVFIVGLFGGYCAVYQSHLNSIDLNNRPSGLYTETAKHPERYYVLDPTTADEYMTYTDNFIHPMWGYKETFLSNIDGFGFFHKTDEMHKRTLPSNIYNAVINRKYVYVIDNSITFKKEKYLKTYYTDGNSNIIYNLTDEFNGYKIYQIQTEAIAE